MPVSSVAFGLFTLALLIPAVVLHEIAHHFGIDDDRLVELGAY